MENIMKNVRVEKVVLSMGIGESGEKLEKSFALAEKITEHKPVRTLATKKARTFKVRKGLPIGVKVTMRNERGVEFLKKILPAVDNKLKSSSFDNEGNFGFGIKEYLDIPGQKYDPKIGMFGLNVIVSLGRKGNRIKRRKIQKRKIPKKQRISKEEAINFVKEKLGIDVV
jgi:large subunit ribosomal protein L5